MPRRPMLIRAPAVIQAPALIQGNTVISTLVRKKKCWIAKFSDYAVEIEWFEAHWDMNMSLFRIFQSGTFLKVIKVIWHPNRDLSHISMGGSNSTLKSNPLQAPWLLRRCQAGTYINPWI